MGIRRVHTFSKGISPKVSVIARLGFELAYYDIAVQHVNHYATWTLTYINLVKKVEINAHHF